ncbi:protein of unknown function [Acidithiobacillus ferrivorans]|uniref:Uncharacterized protein n=1 Tax=Acidithiobacillus ferrivorans TaxID=160808 RepID=A0A060UQI0_9PROT|nr:hypothetical protein AFERRI_400282 [Acidithiobacillus ferrivorans]SMH64531.1 protein of unknown function [Acidithiobacillus ferrivorans]
MPSAQNAIFGNAAGLQKADEIEGFNLTKRRDQIDPGPNFRCLQTIQIPKKEIYSISCSTHGPIATEY